MAFTFAKTGVQEAKSYVLKERDTLRPIFAAVEAYIKDNDLTLYAPDHVMGREVSPSTFYYVIYCPDDPKLHAFAISDIVFKKGELTTLCMQQFKDYVVTARFRKLFRLKKSKAHAHEGERIAAPISGIRVQCFSTYLALADSYFKLLDPLNASTWESILERESVLRGIVESNNKIIHLRENRDEPMHKDVFDIMIGFLAQQTNVVRVLVDAYAVAFQAPPKSRRIQYIAARKLEDEQRTLEGLLKGIDDVHFIIHYLKAPSFEHIRRLEVKVRGTSFADVVEINDITLVPYTMQGDMAVASAFATCLILVFDFLNIPSVSEQSDFVRKRKTFLLSKLSMLGRHIDDAKNKQNIAFLFPQRYIGTYVDPRVQEKLLMKGPPITAYVPVKKFQQLQMLKNLDP